MIVVLEFSQEKEIILVISSFAYKKPEVLVEFLVNLFSLFFGLYVVDTSP